MEGNKKDVVVEAVVEQLVCPSCGEPLEIISECISKQRNYLWKDEKKMFMFSSEEYLDAFADITLYCGNCNSELPDDLEFDIGD